jgi:hypothetical protein
MRTIHIFILTFIFNNAFGNQILSDTVLTRKQIIKLSILPTRIHKGFNELRIGGQAEFYLKKNFLLILP